MYEYYGLIIDVGRVFVLIKIEKIMRLVLFKVASLIALFMLTSCTILSEKINKSLPLLSVSFIAVGDMPYLPKERAMLTAPHGEIVQAIKAFDPVVLLHFGDLKSGGTACTNELLLSRREQLFNLWPFKVMFAPGDNDWTDCDRKSLMPRFDELERLTFLRENYFSGEGSKLTNQLPNLIRQPDFIENAKWSVDGLVFGTINIPGTNNGRAGIELGNSNLIYNEADRRDEFNQRWVDKLFNDAKHANGLVITFQADIYQPSIQQFPVQCSAKNRSQCDGYMNIREYIEVKSAQLNKPVLIIHGDTSAYCFHQPVVQTAKNLWRLNGLGDYKISDAAQITFNPSNTNMPFNVVSLLGQQELPKVCEYRTK